MSSHRLSETHLLGPLKNMKLLETFMEGFPNDCINFINSKLFNQNQLLSA